MHKSPETKGVWAGREDAAPEIALEKITKDMLDLTKAPSYEVIHSVKK